MSELKKPNFLKKGDTIAIVATAGKIDNKSIEYSIGIFESWGLKVLIGETIGVEYHKFAGTDNLRAKDLQKMLDNSLVKAIVFARGGYGTIRIIDKIDFTKFMLSSKWIVGYSDITVLHAHINNYLAVQTMHATMPINFETNTKESLSSLKKCLFGEVISYKWNSNLLNTFGKIKGKIIGGNLSILYSILGTKSGFNTDNKILFFEEVGENLYHIDRMIIALKRAGKFNKLKALVVGSFTDIEDDSFGKNYYEIILEHTKEFDFPICFDFPAGHQEDNNSIIFGKNVILDIKKKKCELKFI